MASDIKISGQPSEIHTCGDMNLDAMNGKWMNPSYHLYKLSRMVHSVCNRLNFTQLVTEPTRFQFNSVTGKTNVSCIDHVYTNSKLRCSNVSVTSFGNSDHELVGYIRYLKDPPSPSRITRLGYYDVTTRLIVLIICLAILLSFTICCMILVIC